MAVQALAVKGDSTYIQQDSLADRIIARLKDLRMTKTEMAIKIGVSRPMLSRYLSNKYEGNKVELEAKLEKFLIDSEKDVESTKKVFDKKSTGSIRILDNTTKNTNTVTLQRIEAFENYDFKNIIGLCHSCQRDAALGLVVGKSGFGKTHALKHYAKLPRVLYLECNESMNNKDIIRRIEKQIGMPKCYGSIDERMEAIIDFFNINRGYLLIVDEADKLLNKYTIKRIELLRNIADGAAGNVGIVLAGEPVLESYIKSYDERFAKRMDLYWKLVGLTEDEVRAYLSGYSAEEDAVKELMLRACNGKTGCFRLFDRTLKNVFRILQENDETHITHSVIRQASSMMML